MTSSLLERAFDSRFLNDGRNGLSDGEYEPGVGEMRAEVLDAEVLTVDVEVGDARMRWRRLTDGRNVDELETVAGVSKEARNKLVADDDLASAMLKTVNALVDYFPGHLFTIEPQEDPYEESKNLILSVHTTFGWKEAVRRLEQFDESFWLSSGYNYSDFFVHLNYGLV